MNQVATHPGPVIRSIPLSQLELAPENVRKTRADPAAQAELKALHRSPRIAREPRRPRRRPRPPTAPGATP